MEEHEIHDVRNKKNKKIYAINIFIILLIFVGILLYMLHAEGIDNIKSLLKSADYKWVALGAIALIGMWVTEAITVHLPVKKLYPDQKFISSFKITMIGQLFNNITPFASGGQPMQAYVMYKEGRKPSDSLSILSMKFVITQTTLIIFTILVVLSQFDFFSGIFKDLVWIGIVGIIINILVVIALILSGMNKNFIMKISKPLIKLISKIHIGKFSFIKNPEKTIQKFDASVTNYSNQFRKMKEQKGLITSMALVGLLQSIFYYSITFMIYKAFGNSGHTFLEIITTQAFLMLIMTFFPTPGAGLGAEGGFLLLFNSIFQNGTINMSILFWRIFTFYLPLIAGSLFFVYTINKQKDEVK